jgi:acyl carrier protein
MSNAEVVKKYIVTEFLPDVAVEELEDGYDLLASGVIDSLGLLRLVSWLETEFELPIDDVEIVEQDFVSVDAICAFIDRVGVARVPAETES